MASLELSARLRYLNSSAHVLAGTAPETSRHLMSRHNSLLRESNIESSEGQQRKSCGACGTIMVLGRSGTLETQPAGRKRKHPDPTAKAGRVMVYKCDSCHSTTRHILPPPPPISRTKPTPSVPIPTPSSTGAGTLPRQADSAPSQPSSSSKKRAKGRKQSSLQAILAKQKASQTSSGSGFGLDLMDFMNQG